MTSDYSNYSLNNLNDWLHDALDSDATIEEIYRCINDTIQEKIDYHQKCVNRAKELQTKLKGNNSYDYFNWSGYAASLIGQDNVISEFSDDTITFFNINPNKWVLPVEIDAASGEYYLQLPDDLLNTLNWKEGDTIEYSDNGDGSFTVKKV